MKIEIDVPLNAEETKQLAGILGVKANELGKALQPFAKSATDEYVRMFLGQRVFTRGRDALEFRLFLLIRGAFGNKIPDEKRVCALFQYSPTQARSLIRAVMSKYQYDLSEAIDATLTDHQAGCEGRRRQALSNHKQRESCRRPECYAGLDRRIVTASFEKEGHRIYL